MVMKVVQQSKMLTICIKQEWLVHQVFFTKEMTLCMTKQEFLSCKANNAHFLKLFDNHSEAIGFQVFYSEGDANILITEKAVEAAHVIDTIPVADGTDILISFLGVYISHPKPSLMVPVQLEIIVR
ncbi:hypothetical protein QYM36_012992 [Artemia franciscana]|uniref:Uncharacterized protein n=1 Tax=Artemia franciscana TaxID=6661 RepID=A0AA88HKC1_ARTSF|nr:hypothetical protein QYM36_012992 [Artemia franciscana]